MLHYQNKSLKDIQNEVWKEVPGFEGYILVSNMGRIKSLSRFVTRVNAAKGYWIKDKILSQQVQKVKNNYTGDYTYHLFCKVGFNGSRIGLSMRRIVYELFIDADIQNKDKRHWVVTVKDGNGLNCSHANLQLIDVGERLKRSLQTERNVPAYYKTDAETFREGIKKMSRSNWIPVKQYSIEGKLINVYASIKEAAEKTGIKSNVISAVAKGRMMHAHKFVWRYEGHEYKGELKALRRFLKVTQYSLAGEKITQYSSLNEASIKTGISTANITSSLKRKTSKAGGYIWRYEDDPV